MNNAFTLHHKQSRTPKSKSRARGFTLVELSIVLIIIGLIVGGILAGADMIKAAQHRAFISDMGKLTMAINVFRNKYGHIPGDLTNATDFWGTQSECATYNMASYTGTCNGDGNHVLSWLYESAFLGEHLELAELIEPIELFGTSTDYRNITSYSPFNGWSYFYTNDINDASDEGVYGGILENGLNGITMTFAQINSNDASWRRPVVTPADAWAIDQKADDGIPRNGWIMGGVGADPELPEDCYDSATAYNVDETDELACRLIVWLQR